MSCYVATVPNGGSVWIATDRGGLPPPSDPPRPPASRIRVSEKPFGRTIFFDAAPIVFVKKSSKSEASSRWKAHNVLFGKHTMSCLESTHCPVWKAHIVLFGKHTFSCLANTDSLVWRAHILLFGKHTFSCFESTHSLVWKAPHRV